MKKPQGKTYEKKLQSSAQPRFKDMKPKGSDESLDLTSESSGEQMQLPKPSRGKQKELNNQLQMKANELEKLFAAHKLRVPGENASSTRKEKPPDSQDSSYGAVQKLGDLNLLDDGRGKFYETYMQKRDAKLREEWGTRRVQKEAKMKELQDSLEYSRAEMKGSFGGSAGRMDPTSCQHSMRNNEQLVVFQPSEKKDGAEESYELNDYSQDTLFNENPSSDCSSKSSHSEKPPSRKYGAVSTQTAVLQVPKCSTRPINYGSGKHRTQVENPLARSVPNFSDLHKENTILLPGINKSEKETQGRRYTRVLHKNGILNQSKITRKASASPVEINLSTQGSGKSSLFPLKTSKEKNESNQTCTNIQSNLFPRKGSGVYSCSGGGGVQLKVSALLGNLKNEEESRGSASQIETSSNMGKDGDVKDKFGKITTGDVSRIDNKESLNEDSIDSGDQESENGEILGSFSQVKDDSLAMPDTTSSKFNMLVTTQESPAESPASWNSRTRCSSPYAQEASDIDASVDSLEGIPPLWNSGHTNQMAESDAVRMRKMWGNAQKLNLVSHTSHQSKDKRKGFKRLLKFGRKSKGSDTRTPINGQFSASTNSEGDEDIRDSRDPTNQMSDDMQKSRAGRLPFPSGNYCFKDGNVSQDQANYFGSLIPAVPADFKMRKDHLSGSSLKAPRSFFSLSAFRSKGN